MEKHLTPRIFSAIKYCGVDLTSSGSTQGWPLVETPAPLTVAILTYLAIVFYGTWRIKNSQLKPRLNDPWLLRAAILSHNLVLFLLSLYMCIGIVSEATKQHYSLWGNVFKREEKRMAFLIYLFYISKYLEFGDTFIMLARRSIRQISFLHVYHHSSIAAIWWAITFHAPGGDAYFSAALNSGVHVLMYGYYFLAAMIGKDEERKRRYLFWGRYVTQLQMTQFVFNLAQALWIMRNNGPYPIWVAKVLFYYMISLLALFGHFYIQKYLSPKAVKAAKKVQ